MPIPAIATGSTTPAPLAAVLTTFMSFVIAVALLCTVPAALMLGATLRILYPDIVIFACAVILPDAVSDVNVPVLVILGCAAVVNTAVE